MARRVGAQLDFQDSPALNFVANRTGTAPASPALGEQWTDDSEGGGSGVLRVYEGPTRGWQKASQFGSELLVNKNMNNGYAGLDANGKLHTGVYDFANFTETDFGRPIAANDARLSDSRPSFVADYITLSQTALTGVYSIDAQGGSSGLTILVAGQTNAAENGLWVMAAGAWSRHPSYNTITKVRGATVGVRLGIGGGNTYVLESGSGGTGSLGTTDVSVRKLMRYADTEARYMLNSARLDQIVPPDFIVSMNGQRISALADPVNPGDAANKSYVDSRAAGLDPKASVRAATTASVGTYTAAGGAKTRGQITAAPTSIDNVTLVAGDRVLVKNHSTAAANGIYVVTTVGTGATGVWDRATDFDDDAEVNPGAFVFVEQGTQGADTGWVLGSDGNVIIGGASGSAITWVQFSGAGAWTAGAGLTQTGTTMNVVGTANRITVNTDSVDIASTYVGQTSITTLGIITAGTWRGTAVELQYGGTGANATTAAGKKTARDNLQASGVAAATLGAIAAGAEVTFAHNLGTEDVVVAVKNVSTSKHEDFEIRVIDANTVGITSHVAYAASALRVAVIG